MLANTYHLFLRPGAELVAEFGGLHRFMGWDGPMLTDSGGFQVFSLSHNRKIDDDGVTFRSHLDGSRHRFTPESVIATRRAARAPTSSWCWTNARPYPSDAAYNRQALARTHAWAARCRARAAPAPTRPSSPSSRAACSPTCARESARALAELDSPATPSAA